MYTSSSELAEGKREIGSGHYVIEYTFGICDECHVSHVTCGLPLNIHGVSVVYGLEITECIQIIILEFIGYFGDCENKDCENKRGSIIHCSLCLLKPDDESTNFSVSRMCGCKKRKAICYACQVDTACSNCGYPVCNEGECCIVESCRCDYFSNTCKRCKDDVKRCACGAAICEKCVEVVCDKEGGGFQEFCNYECDYIEEMDDEEENIYDNYME